MSPAQSGTNFLFVHENANTITRAEKDPELDRVKQSHVQRQNFANRRQQHEQALALRSDSAKQSLTKLATTGGQPYGGQNPSLDFSNVDLFPAFYTTQPSELVLDRGGWQTSGASSIDLLNTYEPGQFFGSAATTLSPRDSSPTQASASTYNPLSTLPLQPQTISPILSEPEQILEKWAPPLIQHHNTVILPEKFFADTRHRPLGQTRHAAAIHEDTASAMSDPAHLYAFLASAAAQMLCREGRLFLPDLKEEDSPRVPLFFMTKAMHALRGSLARGAIDRALVMDVHRLIATAYFLRAYDTVDPHFQAMMSMIESLGGINAVGDYFEETNILLDWSAGLKRLAPGRLPLYWDPGRGSPAITEILDLFKLSHDGLGARMFPIFDKMKMQPLLTDTFADLVELTRFHRWVQDRPSYEPAHFRYIVLRHTALGCRLLAMRPESTTTDQEEAFRIALIFWTALTRCPTSGKRCASKQVDQLRMRLESSQAGRENSVWQRYNDLLLWISVVGGLAAVSQVDCDWFARLAAKTAPRVRDELGSDLAEMEKVLTGFLYEPSLQRAPVLDFMARMHSVSASQVT